MAHRDENLEHLRALILFKSQLASPELMDLLAHVDNPYLSEFFSEIVHEATEERTQLESALREWADHRRDRSLTRYPSDVSYRDVVVEWAALLQSSARRARLTALSAPTSELRGRIEAIAEADERRASHLQGFL